MAQRVSAKDSATRQSLSSIRIGLLGPLTIDKDGQRIELSGPKRRALLTLLSLHIDDPLGREQIIEALWPRRQTGREDSTLRVHISHLRDELETDRDREPKVLLTRGQAYMLSGHVVDTDIRRFDELVREARQHIPEDPGIAVDLLDEALELWRGRALQDVEYEEFAQDEIRRLDRARIGAIRDRAEAMIAIGEDAAAIQDLEPLVRDDPTDEGAVALLMRALYRTGRQSEALRVASRLTRQLRDRGLEPSPHVVLLEEQIINHDPDLLPEGTLPPGEIKPGRSVRGYELREEAGRGSIGVVYRAFQPAVGREVAVKAINPDLAQSPEFVRRFGEEAKVIAGLEHPHIVPLHDFWREPGGAFLVMRWMEGGSLADRLSVAWEEDRLARVFDQVAAALGHAHSCGVVHRDVKPENILFDGDDNAYLCDFGLAAAGIETGASGSGAARTAEPPYAAPEIFREEGPTVAADIFGLGVLLAEAASGVSYPDARDRLSDRIWEVVNTATSANPADRYPDVAAFRTALREAIGDAPAPAPKTVRRNPYKGLEPFEETDSADFYGRDDAVESLLDAVASKGLVALIGASGSGKSSVVRAGLIPQLREGALPGSEQWSIVTMYPGDDPFEEFRVALRDAAVGPMETSTDRRSEELREMLLAALDGPTSRALLAVDQFEELFSSSIEEETRSRFLDNLVDLASDHLDRFRVVLTMRADFSDRPLSHPTFGDLFAKSSLMLAPMRPDQLEDVIRRPAARVGIQVEPGLISEIVRDVTDAPGYLPLLQYVLAELFERRSEDRLTVQAYRSLGGVQGVVERRAEATFASLDEDAKAACRQLFLRMVHLGDHGEETRRRLPLTEVAGLGARVATETALEAFSSARLVAYDRDPVSRTPTVEVAHETVIERWTRYRVWIDEARTDLLAQRRVSASAQTWVQADEDPAFLLTGGPLNEALELVDDQRVDLNQLETRFVEESREAARAAEEAEVARRRHEADLEQRSRRRLRVGVGSGLIAVVVAVLALVAWNQSQRAGELTAVQSRENLARELAAASGASLTSGDYDLSLLLAIAAAEETLGAGGEILPEAVEALHLAVINPRPRLELDGAIVDSGGKGVSYSGDGTALAYVTNEGVAAVIDPLTGSEHFRTESVGPPAFGVDFHPEENRLLTIHPDGLREWSVSTGEMTRPMLHQEQVSTAAYSSEGTLVALGDDQGSIIVHGPEGEVFALEEGGHEGAVHSIDFSPSGERVVSAGADGQVLVWDLATESVTQSVASMTDFCVSEAAWHPLDDQIAVTMCHPEAYSFHADTGERLQGFSTGNQRHVAMVYDSSGALVAGAGADGFTRLFSTGVGGAPVAELPNGGIPVGDVEFNPNFDSLELVTLGVDGELRIWRPILARSELPVVPTTLLFGFMDATPDGSRYIFGSNGHIFGLPQNQEVLPPTFHVVDAGSGEIIATEEALHSLRARHKPAISDDGSKAAFAGPSGNLTLVDVDQGVSEEIPDSARWTVDIDFSFDGELLAGAGRNGQIVVWDVASLEKVRVMTRGADTAPDGRLLQARAINEIHFIPGSDDVVTGGADGSVRRWDPSDGTNRVLHVFGFQVWSVDVSADGSTIAAADITGDVRLLDADTGEEISPRPQRVAGEVHVVFSPDGHRLAGGGPGPYVHLWDLESGEIVRRLEGAIGKPGVVFVNGGDELRAMGATGMVRGYVTDPVELLEIARDEVGREMTEEECQQYLRRPCDG